MGQRKRVEFGDQTVKPERFDRPEKFQMKAGTTYRVRVLQAPQAAFGANVKFAGEDKGFWAWSLADYDDCEKALKGDKAALAKCKKACPLWARNYDITRRFVAPIVKVGISRGGKTSRLCELIPWIFANEKYAEVTNIISTLPLNPKTKKKRALRSCELSISCTETQFQKASMAIVTDPSVFLSKWDTVWEKVKDQFADPENPNSDCTLLDEFMQPDGYAQMMKSLDRAEGKGKMEDEDGEGEVTGEGEEELEGEEPAPKPKAGAKKPAPKPGIKPGAKPPAKPPVKKPKDEVEELEEALGDGDDDLTEGEAEEVTEEGGEEVVEEEVPLEDEEPAPAPARRGRPPKR